jgi:GTP-binding protein
VTDISRQRVFTFDTEGELHKILKGGNGGLGNEHFKTSINRSPDKSTLGRAGESGDFLIELSLIVDVGIIGFPNAGKSTLLNALTKAKSRIGAYPFTTVEPHLGDLYGYTLADIPGLIEGASHGKGLGHKFLRHTQRTKMLLHCISLEEVDVLVAYTTIRNELATFDTELLKKKEWVILTKSDLSTKEKEREVEATIQKLGVTTFVVSAETDSGVKELQDTLTAHLKKTEEMT